MIRDWLKLDSAWQPLTFKGVAAFAKASFARLLLFQILFATAASGTVVWVLNQAWRPVIEQGIDHLPGAGEIRDGELRWPAESPSLLAENRFLALIVDLNHEGTIRVPAHVQVEFGAKDVRVISLFGFWERRYTTDNWIIDFNKPAVEPWWGAWRVPLRWIAFGVSFAGLILTWWLLATVYFVPAWLFAFFSNRQLALGGAWRLAGAALLPGALLMTSGVFLYGVGGIGVVELLAIQAAHWVTGLVYLVGAASKLPPTEISARNPFDRTSPEDGRPRRSEPKNPFQGPP